jgi:sugar lactone lactonase YvrE
MEVERIGDVVCALGEGPVWDQAEGVLYFVDSFGPIIFRYDPQSGDMTRREPPGRTIGSLALRERGGMIIAMDDGFHTYDFESGACQAIAEPEAGLPDTRFNDGKVDRQGRFIAGSLENDADVRPCGLYRLDGDLSIERIEDGIGCTNGPCWSPDGATFYFTDGSGPEIYAYDYDQAAGTLSGKRLFTSTEGIGYPDGATVDAEGHVWSAMFGASCVARFTPDGALERRVEVPASAVTSMNFGGPGLDVLFVTSASADVGGGRDESPLAGALFAITGLGVGGIAEPRFKG